MGDHLKPKIREIYEHLCDVHKSHEIPMVKINRFIDKINLLCYWNLTNGSWEASHELYSFLNPVDWTGEREYSFMAQVSLSHL